MKGLARLVAIFARWLLRREWSQLRDRLARAYQSHVDNHASCPSVLAQQLLISGEDHRFFSHGGIDHIAVCRALWRGVVLRRPEPEHITCFGSTYAISTITPILAL